MLCEDAEIDTPDDKIKWVCRYASHDEVELWVTLPARQGNDWNAFINEVKAFYPGAEDDDRKYMHADLNGLVTAQAAVPMASHGALSEYIRNFMCIASFLEKRKKISQGEQEVKFLDGFHPTFKTQLLNRLTLVFLDHYLDKPWPMKDIIAHVMFLLMGSSARTSKIECMSTEPQAPSMPLPTIVKKEYYTTGSSYMPAPQSTYVPPQQSYAPPLQPYTHHQHQYTPPQQSYAPLPQQYTPQNAYAHHQYAPLMDRNA
ncbi:hypothetical protein ID866_7723 [Astraeus odoratus]|nr:hypothetical protein ID866_7723 [Astraeus odoratus]